MEAVVLEDTPLAEYLEGHAGDDHHGVLDRYHDAVSAYSIPVFAPRGWPILQPRIRLNLPPALRLAIPQSPIMATIRKGCSKALSTQIGCADNARFLERFRYIIVASQLLNSHAFSGHGSYSRPKRLNSPTADENAVREFSLSGALTVACSAFALTWLIHWARGSHGTNSFTSKRRMVIVLAVMFLASVIGYMYMRLQLLKYVRLQSIAELSKYVDVAQDFDAVVIAALALVQEVELVSRGFRLSAPLPPISRMEDRGQARRCLRLRKELRLCFTNVMSHFNQAYAVLRPLAKDIDLEKYYDIYEVDVNGISDSPHGCTDQELDGSESIRILKLLANQCTTIRRRFLCCLMALEADGGKQDYLPWRKAADEIGKLHMITDQASCQVDQVLQEEQSFLIPASPKAPFTPSRERRRTQLRKLNSLSAGLRTLQAKLHVLREESDLPSDDTENGALHGESLKIEYESIGIDLKALIQEWEDGKAALALVTDGNERRISSMSSVLSPTSSIGGATAVDEGGSLDALSVLNGERLSGSSMEFKFSDVEEVYEAISAPRQRSSLTREERIARLKDNRTKGESMKSSKDANTRMLKELESVIKLRPRAKTNTGTRVTSI